jgi:hypothetical protein
MCRKSAKPNFSSFTNFFRILEFAQEHNLDVTEEDFGSSYAQLSPGRTAD